MALLETNAITRLATVSSLEMSNTTSAQTLYTVPSAKESGAAVTGCLITHIVMRSAQISQTSGQFGIGFNSTAYADVMPVATHTALTGSTVFQVYATTAGCRVGVSADVLKLNCSVGQATTSNTLSVDIFGLLF